MKLRQDEISVQQDVEATVEVPEQWSGEAAGEESPPRPLPRPIPRPIPIPIPWPLRFGHRFRIYKQDPSVAEPGVRLVYIPSLVLNGPTDARIQTVLAGTTPVARNLSGDFVFAPGTPQFDCANTFAVVRQALTMYERHNGGVPIPFAWNTGGNTERLTVEPHGGVGANAFYSRTAKKLSFLFFTPAGKPPSAAVFTCRSFDIIAHEMGHAVLDGLKPGWLAFGNPPQTGGLHESFGDLTAIFLALSQTDQAEALVALTKANLHQKSFLPEVAEEFGAALGLPTGLRNADNDLKLSQVGNQVHAISQVFTGAIYDVLADVFHFEEHRQRRTKDAALVLVEVAAALGRLLFDAIKASPATAATYVDVANRMLQLSAARGEPAIYRTFIRNRFAVREIITASATMDAVLSGEMTMTDADFTGAGGDVTQVEAHDPNSASLRAEQDRTDCCGTMQMPEYYAVGAEKLAAGGSLTDDDILHDDLEELRQAFSD